MQENTSRTLVKRQRLDGFIILDKKKHKALYYDKAIKFEILKNGNHLVIWNVLIDRKGEPYQTNYCCGKRRAEIQVRWTL